MFAVIIFILLGIIVGYFLRRRQNSWLSAATTSLVWLLLFLMGIEVGTNDHIIRSLPTLGLEALLLSLFATLGSCIGAWLLWRYIIKKENISK